MTDLLQRCSCCRATILLETYFTKNRKGVWFKCCNPCRERGRKAKSVPLLIYPTSIYKYTGGIEYNKKNERYRARIREDILKMSVEYDTWNEAFLAVKLANIENNLPIKNMIIDRNSHYSVALTKEAEMLFDKDDITLIQNSNIFADVRDNTTYARTRVSGGGHGSPLFMHNVVMRYTPDNGMTIDHINGNGLDNRKSSLRIVNQSVQTMNRRMTRNKSGHVGICESGPNLEASFSYNKQRFRKLFSNTDDGKQEAIEWLASKKDEIIPELERVSREQL